MLQPKDPGKMQRALKVQVMNHVMRRQLNLESLEYGSKNWCKME